LSIAAVPIPASGSGLEGPQRALARSRGEGRKLVEPIEIAGREIDGARGQPPELFDRKRQSGLSQGFTSFSVRSIIIATSCRRRRRALRIPLHVLARPDAP
jgi:hypothetical protein